MIILLSFLRKSIEYSFHLKLMISPQIWFGPVDEHVCRNCVATVCSGYYYFLYTLLGTMHNIIVFIVKQLENSIIKFYLDYPNIKNEYIFKCHCYPKPYITQGGNLTNF